MVGAAPGTGRFPESHARSHTGIGNTYGRLGRLSEAEEAYLRTLAISRSVCDEEHKRVVLFGLARLNGQSGRLPEVVEQLVRASELHYADDLDPALAACVQRSLRGLPLAAVGPHAEPLPPRVSAYGMHLYTATTVEGRDCRRLERVCRYLLRPRFEHDAVAAPSMT